MSFVFVTGALPAGRDGIGDYCRVLADAVAATATAPALLSLADAAEEAGLERFPTLRLAAARPWPERIALARRFLEEQRADRVFLQLSPYLYQPRGLLQEAAPHLGALLAERRPLVMVHETWVGELPYHGWKDRLIGPWQRRGFLSALAAVQPGAVFTNLPLHRQQLARHAIDATLLPLPGNAAVSDAQAPLTLVPPVAGIFGALWPRFDPSAALDGFVREAGGAATLLLVGRHGAPQRLAAWRQRHPGLTIVETGPLDVAALSGHLNLLSFAIGISPWELAGKSGTIAALLEHGVPVLTVWGDPGQPSGVPDDRAALLHPPGSPVAPLLARRPGSGPFRPQAPTIAARLVSALDGR